MAVGDKEIVENLTMHVELLSYLSLENKVYSET